MLYFLMFIVDCFFEIFDCQTIINFSNPQRLDLVNCFDRQDLQLHQIAMLLHAELQSNGIMGQLYVESLTQMLVIHLLRHYSTFTKTITSGNRGLTNLQLQQAIEYIHTHLDQDLSL